MSNDIQPEIRFPGFTEAWEQRKFECLLDKKDGVRRGPFGSALKKEFFVSNSNFVVYEQQNAIYDNYETRYKITEKKYNELIKFKLEPGDFIMSGAGTIGRISRVPKQIKPGVFNQALIRLRINKEITDSEYFIQFIRADFMQRKLTGANPGSAITNLVPMSEVKKWIVQFPILEEQKKIGNFFKQLDDTIALQQRKLDLLKETKKGFLQKMFPKNGAKVPEIRFPGFTDDWEQRKLASMTNYKNGKGHEDKQSTIGKLELINLNSISISGGLKHSGKFIDEADDTLQKDDLVMILSDVGHGDLLGRVALIPEDDRFVLNQRVALLRPNATADPQFLFSYINAHQYYFKAQGAGMSQLNISKGSVENFISFVPIIEEQKKIGTFFKQLDDTIALHQRKLDLLKETKKGFLQKMFV
ncbi:restriction endonuclease subunit S [Enterococcus faecium]|uniref:restriction endonuclease subunit S n=1 Tax=Enterococcus faecium TaxID=1352 RepID=UPI00288CBD14|nr:restriction endonuclease subunit S [Enterococcus faecium]MDT2301308.1 restriction endonuclease subunit S [Enterococcus faecium]